MNLDNRVLHSICDNKHLPKRSSQGSIFGWMGRLGQAKWALYLKKEAKLCHATLDDCAKIIQSNIYHNLTLPQGLQLRNDMVSLVSPDVALAEALKMLALKK